MVCLPGLVTRGLARAILGGEMRDFATWIIVVAGVMTIALGALAAIDGDEMDWRLQRSPQTGICYESHRVPLALLGLSEAMSPVDSSYCDEEAPDARS